MLINLFYYLYTIKYLNEILYNKIYLKQKTLNFNNVIPY